MILAQEIKKLRLLDADWDGEGALPVDANVIEHIKTFTICALASSFQV